MSLIWQFRYTNYVIWIAYYITVVTPTNVGLLKDTFFYIDSFLYDNAEHLSGTDYYDDCTVIYQMKDEKISSFSSILIIIDKLVRSSKWQLTLTHIRYTYTIQCSLSSFLLALSDLRMNNSLFQHYKTHHQDFVMKNRIVHVR